MYNEVKITKVPLKRKFSQKCNTVTYYIVGLHSSISRQRYTTRGISCKGLRERGEGRMGFPLNIGASWKCKQTVQLNLTCQVYLVD